MADAKAAGGAAWAASRIRDEVQSRVEVWVIEGVRELGAGAHPTRGAGDVGPDRVIEHGHALGITLGDGKDVVLGTGM